MSTDRTQPGATGPNRTPDRMPTYTVAEMAAMLGISTDAVRARVNRGTLHGTKVGGVWQVRPPDDWPIEEVAAVDRPDPTGTRPDALIEQLRSENAYLRDQLAGTIQQLADERERADVLHREALGRIEALSAAVGSEVTAHQGDASDAPEGIWSRLVRFWKGGMTGHG